MAGIIRKYEPRFQAASTEGERVRILAEYKTEVMHQDKMRDEHLANVGIKKERPQKFGKRARKEMRKASKAKHEYFREDRPLMFLGGFRAF
jgi:hypothetical protein